VDAERVTQAGGPRDGTLVESILTFFLEGVRTAKSRTIGFRLQLRTRDLSGKMQKY